MVGPQLWGSQEYPRPGPGYASICKVGADTPGQLKARSAIVAEPRKSIVSALVTHGNMLKNTVGAPTSERFLESQQM